MKDVARAAALVAVLLAWQAVGLRMPSEKDNRPLHERKFKRSQNASSAANASSASPEVDELSSPENDMIYDGVNYLEEYIFNRMRRHRTTSPPVGSDSDDEVTGSSGNGTAAADSATNAANATSESSAVASTEEPTTTLMPKLVPKPLHWTSYERLDADIQDYIQDADNYLEEFIKYPSPNWNESVADNLLNATTFTNATSSLAVWKGPNSWPRTPRGVLPPTGKATSFIKPPPRSEAADSRPQHLQSLLPSTAAATSLVLRPHPSEAATMLFSRLASRPQPSGPATAEEPSAAIQPDSQRKEAVKGGMDRWLDDVVKQSLAL